MNTRNPIVNGIFTGAMSGFILAIPIILFELLNIGSYYTAYSLAFVLLMPFFKTLYLGILVGASLSLVNMVTEQEVWSKLGILLCILTGLVIGLITESLISWTVKLTLLSLIIVFIKNNTFPSYQEGPLSNPLFKRQKVMLGVLLSLVFLPVGLEIKEHYQYREIAPFFDGLYIEYGDKFGDLLKVSAIENNRFKIIETEKRRILGGSVTEYIVNQYGIIENEMHTSSDGEATEWVSNIDEFTHIWIPVNSLKVGNMLKDKRDYVDRKDKWKNWEVLVIKDSIIDNIESYYEINTGYLVGYSAADYYLIDTNANIPTIE